MTARILIVDDVAANTVLLAAKLTSEYYLVATAMDGREALYQAEAWQPDLVLLDVMMPDLDGYETCRRLKLNADTHHIPIVMITALDQPSERLRGLEAGADDFLTKPVDFDTLLARVRSLVRLKRLLDEWRARAETVRSMGLSAEILPSPRVAGARALVIDDQDGTAEAVQSALGLDGVLAARARTDTEALKLSATIGFDLIVLSLSIGSGDALRLASALRAADATHNTPLLLVAEPEQRRRVLRGFDLGANDWLMLPIDPGELRARARNQIRRKYYQDRLRSDLGHALEMALTDPLTSFYNQRYLLRHLEELLRPRPPTPVSLMMIDVDHFKIVNDRYGHAAGDRALQAIAEVLRARTRVFDSIARYGGEEFVVVMPGTLLPDAALAAERLRDAVEMLEFAPEQGVRHRLTVSIGVTCSPNGDTTPPALLQNADRAMYRAKRAGRNRIDAT